MSRPSFRSSAEYRASHLITTRWMDNDNYNHVNNVIYYSWFDTAVNAFLIKEGLLDTESGTLIGLVVESQCRYARPISFPEQVTVRLRAGHIGTSSVRYEIGLFSNEHEHAAAEGHFIHVYVDRKSRRPTSLPDNWRAALHRISAITSS